MASVSRRAMRIGGLAVASCAAVCVQVGVAAAQSRTVTLAEVLSRAREHAPQVVGARRAVAVGDLRQLLRLEDDILAVGEATAGAAPDLHAVHRRARRHPRPPRATGGLHPDVRSRGDPPGGGIAANRRGGLGQRARPGQHGRGGGREAEERVDAPLRLLLRPRRPRPPGTKPRSRLSVACCRSPLRSGPGLATGY